MTEAEVMTDEVAGLVTAEGVAVLAGAVVYDTDVGPYFRQISSLVLLLRRTL